MSPRWTTPSNRRLFTIQEVQGTYNRQPTTVDEVYYEGTITLHPETIKEVVQEV